MTVNPSTIRSGSETLLVGNALRAPDLFEVGAISGDLEIDDSGCWSLRSGSESVTLVAPGGSRTDTSGHLIVGGAEFNVGDRVELQGGVGSRRDETCGGGDAIYFWKIAAAQ